MSEPAFQHHQDIHVPGGGVWIDIGGGASFDGLLDPKPGLADSEVVPDPVAFSPSFRPGDGKVRAEPNWIYRLVANSLHGQGGCLRIEVAGKLCDLLVSAEIEEMIFRHSSRRRPIETA